MREKLIAANWKMNGTIAEALQFIAALKFESKSGPRCEVVICPPFTVLYALDEALSGSPFKLGAQNMHWEEKGAFTGEISPEFLAELNVRYVILGHSERRQYFSETDEMVNKKIAAALDKTITPIVCVGETLVEHEAGQTVTKVRGQMEKALKNLSAAGMEHLVWAYEPIWAIGTGKNATAQHAQKVASEMRTLLETKCGKSVAETMRILYGGSVKANNAGDFLKEKDIDGLLVGSASVDPKEFAAILSTITA
ncbi:MAG: triose-phosphate isomerase [Deltaproteobacteria bacterium]|nr:triose-phosphate isomerase [Deltaproteobacteria bacterium]